MIRTQLMLDEANYRELKRRAFLNNQSMSETAREIFSQHFGKNGGKRRKKKGFRRSDFTFIGCFASPRDNVSERHDEVLGEGRW
jgi:hypothetical protein